MAQRSGHPLFSARYDAGMAYHPFGLYVMGGVNVDLTASGPFRRSSPLAARPTVKFYNDVYLSTDDGGSWTFVGMATWFPRAAFGVVVYQNYLIVYGGVGTWLGSVSCFNDIYTSTDGHLWKRLDLFGVQ